MTITIPTFDTQALEEWADHAYDAARDKSGYVRIPASRYDQLRADILAASEHIMLLEFALKQRAA